MSRILLVLFFCIGFTGTLQAAQDEWQTLERLAQRNNKKKFKGEMLHNYRGFKSEVVTLEFNLPAYIELKNAAGVSLLRLEPDRVDTSQPKEHPTLAKAWNLLLDVRRGIASVAQNKPDTFFHYYKSSEYFAIRSFYDRPFQGIELKSADKKVSFESFTAYFDSKDALQSIRVNFKNGLYGSFTVNR